MPALSTSVVTLNLVIRPFDFVISAFAETTRTGYFRVTLFAGAYRIGQRLAGKIIPIRDGAKSLQQVLDEYPTPQQR